MVSGNKYEVSTPDGVCGEWRVETFVVNEEDANQTLIRAAVTGNALAYVPPGAYKRLLRRQFA